MTKLIAVYTTVGHIEQARWLARTMVERRLAACAQIEPIESFYRWKGAVEGAQELRVTFKTTAERYGELEAALREGHPYELPAIHAVAMEHVDTAYAEWIAQGSAP